MEPIRDFSFLEDLFAVSEHLLLDLGAQALEERIRVVGLRKLRHLIFQIVLYDFRIGLLQLQVPDQHLLWFWRLRRAISRSESIRNQVFELQLVLKLKHQESVDHEEVCLLDCDCCVGALRPFLDAVFLLCARCELAKCLAIPYCLEHDGHIAIVGAFQLKSDSTFDYHVHVILKVALTEDSRPCWQDHIVGFFAEKLPLGLVEVVQVFIDAQHLLQRLDLAVLACLQLEFSADEQRLLV